MDALHGIPASHKDLENVSVEPASARAQEQTYSLKGRRTGPGMGSHKNGLVRHRELPSSGKSKIEDRICIPRFLDRVKTTRVKSCSNIFQSEQAIAAGSRALADLFRRFAQTGVEATMMAADKPTIRWDGWVRYTSWALDLGRFAGVNQPGRKTRWFGGQRFVCAAENKRWR